MAFVEGWTCTVLVESCLEYRHFVLCMSAQRSVWVHWIADKIGYDCVATDSLGLPTDVGSQRVGVAHLGNPKVNVVVLGYLRVLNLLAKKNFSLLPIQETETSE